jgi:hypothetical protein
LPAPVAAVDGHAAAGALYTAPPSRFLPDRGAGGRAATQAFSEMLPFVPELLRSEPPK